MEAVYQFQIDYARKQSSNDLKNWIWGCVNCGQPLPGPLNLEACRFVLRERGEDGRGYFDT